LVDFNDQRRGRLTLIRDLLDRLPTVQGSGTPPDMPPLNHEPLIEEFDSLKPIKAFG
jgi:hypothetical protein